MIFTFLVLCKFPVTNKCVAILYLSDFLRQTCMSCAENRVVVVNEAKSEDESAEALAQPLLQKESLARAKPNLRNSNLGRNSVELDKKKI